MPILEVTLAGTYYNQQTISRWNYVLTGAPAAVTPSFALASAFGAIYDLVAVPPGYPPATVLRLMSDSSGNEWDWQQLTVLNPYDPTDFYQNPFVPPYGGVGAGEQMSPAVAIGFRTNQVRRDVARGTKRFPGVLESWVEGGGVLVSTVLAQQNALASKMSEVLTYDDEGNMLSFAPAVCGKFQYDPNPPPALGNHRAYKYWATEAEQLAHTAISVTWQAYPQVRTQVSRQYGHGR